MGASLPPKPEAREPQPKKEPSPAAPPPAQEEEMEVESEESDVELDMEGVVKNPDPEEAHEMVCSPVSSMRQSLRECFLGRSREEGND